MTHTTERQKKDRKQVYTDRCQTLDDYRKVRIDIIENDFMITLTDEEKEHLNSLTTETAIDNAIRAMCKKRWEN